MNRTYRLVWNSSQRRYVAAPETAQGRSKQGASLVLAAAVLAGVAMPALGAPAGGSVSAGTGRIVQQGNTTTVNQSTQNLAINWNSFGIAANETVNFVQPSASAIALNRVLGSDASQIYGHLNANGQVFLLNPNGILFGKTAQVNVGGLVASTLGLGDADFMGGKRSFAGSGGPVTNLGEMTAAPGGYLAFLGAQVSNQGTMQARLGTVALAAGRQVTLDFAGDKLLSLQVDQGALNALAENRHLIQADGGTVLLNAKAADALVSAVVNNTGVIQARTLQDHAGVIRLLGDMQAGEVQVHGTLDASAPQGGNGGFIETSAAHVKVGSDARVTTQAPAGRTGTWLIDPQDYTVAASGGDITGAALSSNLETTSVTLQSSAGAATGAGNVNVNDPVSWSADTTLTLVASHDVNVNARISALSANAALNISPNTANGGEAASGSGTFNLGPGARIDLPNVSANSTTALVIAGAPYTVITDNNKALLSFANSGTGNGALGSDIYLDSGFWTPGRLTNAVFDGLGHAIYDLKSTPIYNYGGNAGLFGWVNNSSIRNVGLVDANVSGDHSSTSFVGGLAAQANNSSIINSYTTGTVSYATDFSYYAGGLVGQGTNLTIVSSYSSSNIQPIDSSILYAGAPALAGGLLGYGVNSTKITNSYATGSVSGPGISGGLAGGLDSSSSISKSYTTGAVTSTGTGGARGAVVGYANNSSLDQVFWNNQTSNAPVVGAGGSVSGTYAGLTTAQLQQQSNFAGWDLANTWIIYNGATNPMLRAFMTPLTMTADDVARTYDGLAYSGGNGVSANVNGATYNWTVGSPYPDSYVQGSLNYSGTSQGAINAGSYPIVASGLFSYHYIFTFAPGTLTVNPAALTVTAGNATKTYGQGTSFGGFSNSALQHGETMGSVSLGSSGASPTASVGSYLIKPSGATGGTFNPANYAITYLPGTLSVTPAGLTVTARSASKSYGESALIDRFSSIGLLSGDTIGSVTMSSAGLPTTANVGSYALVPSAATGGSFSPGNYTITYAPGTLTVNPAALTVTAGNASKTYGNSASLSTFGSSGLQNGETIGSVSLSSAGVAAAADAGLYAITPSAASGGSFNPANYSVAYATGTLTVNPAALTVTAGDLSKTYGQSLVLGGVFTSSGLRNGDSIGSVTLSGAGVLPTANVGNYSITPIGASGGSFNPANYTIAYAPGTLTVNPAALTVFANDASKTYGQNALLTAFGSTGLQNDETIGSVSLSSTGASAAANAGAYAIAPSAASGGSFNPGNYAIDYVQGALTVSPATLTLNAAPAGRSYGAANPALSGQVSGFVNGDTLADITTGSLSFSTAATPTSNVGSYAVNGTGLSTSNGNYVLAQAPANANALTINPASLTVLASDANKTYGQSALLGAFTSNGLQNGETIGSVNASSAGAPAGANVGTYAITPSAASGGSFNAGNYAIAYAPGTLVVDPAILMLSATSATRSYGAANPALGGQVSGFVNGDTLASATAGALTFGTAATSTSNVGSYAVTGAGLSANSGNYVFTQAPANVGALSVTPALLTVTAADASKNYGSNASLSGFSSSGLQNGETIGSISLSSAGAAASANVGFYAITPSAAGGSFDPGNYSLAYAPGTLVVAPSPGFEAAKTYVDRAVQASQAIEAGISEFVVKRKSLSNGLPLIVVNGGILLPQGVSFP